MRVRSLGSQIRPLGRVISEAYTDEGTELTIEISNTSALLTDSEFSLACACLSMTCMELTNAENVTITSGSRSLTLSRDNLLLNDTVSPEETVK